MRHIRAIAIAGQRSRLIKGDSAIDDLCDLAVILGVPRRDLRLAIGSPWYRVRPASYDLDLGPMYVGRDDRSAAILCLSSASELIGDGGTVIHKGGTVLAGMAISTLLPDGTLGWRLGGHRTTLNRGVGLESRSFLMSLRSIVNRAVADQQAASTTAEWRAVPV